MTGEETKAVGVEEFTAIPVSLPPILMKLIGYPASARYVALYYMGSKATWNDGRALSTFSYYSAYQPPVDHPAMAVHLFDAHLGSDDEYPTHALLCDREERTFLVGDYDKAMQFVHQQHTGETVTAEVVAEYEVMAEAPATAGDFRRLGMFEMFMQPDAGAQRDTAMLIEWLDGLITEELVKTLLVMMEKQDYRAFQPFEYIRRLASRMKGTQETEGGQQ